MRIVAGADIRVDESTFDIFCKAHHSITGVFLHELQLPVFHAEGIIRTSNTAKHGVIT